jgi:hypothetical protein
MIYPFGSRADCKEIFFVDLKNQQLYFERDFPALFRLEKSHLLAYNFLPWFYPHPCELVSHLLHSIRAAALLYPVRV